MNRLFVVGDLHGDYDATTLNTKNFPDGKNLTKEDYVVVLGDFSFIWKYEEDKHEFYWKNWLEDKPWTTLVVLGNHENYDRIETDYELVPYLGGMARQYSDSIWILERGYVYTIAGKKCFCFGGANSIDKEHRVEGISWWKKELPNYTEINRGLDNLRANENKVDYVFTHTCPERIFRLLMGPAFSDNDPTRKFFDVLEDECEFDHWHFGHFHTTAKVNSKFTCHYQDVEELDI